MNVHELIDLFVASVARSGGIFHPINEAPWVADLERMLTKRLPASFSSLIKRYSFTPFESGGLYFYANMGTDDADEMSVAIFRDRLIAEATLKAGYIQFARPDTGSYDPICFDTRSAVSNREFPIVRLDHEQILCYDRIYVSERVADSFFRFAADIVGRA
jgi:hypothetical protein